MTINQVGVGAGVDAWEQCVFRLQIPRDSSLFQHILLLSDNADGGALRGDGWNPDLRALLQQELLPKGAGGAVLGAAAAGSGQEESLTIKMIFSKL